MLKLFRYIKNYKKECVLGPLLKLFEALLELFVPLVMAAVVDYGISAADKGYIVKMCILLAVLGIIGFVSSVTAQYFSAKAAVGFAARLRQGLLKHVQRLSYTDLDEIGNSTLITRMTSDINQVQSGVNMMLRLLVRSPFIVFGAMIMAFTIDFKVALIFVATIIILTIVVFSIILYTIPMYKKVQSALDKVLGITRENLTGARVIRAFGKEEQEINEYDSRTHKLVRLQVGVGKISALMNPVTLLIINVATIVLVWTGAVQVDTGRLTQGEVIALVSYMSQILVELVKLANLIVTLTKAVACGNRIEGVFNTTSTIKDAENMSVKVPEDTEYAVEFDHACFKYGSASEELLNDMDFKVKKGSTVGIIGGTGSGKSSLVQLIPRFYDVSAGSVKVDGKDVRDYKLSELRAKIGIVLQKAVLFKGTIRENLLWGNADATEKEILEALDISQSREFVDRKEKGIDSEIEQGGRNLSGGQKQRLTIARAVIRKPEILILDDSSSALDFATDAKLRKAIKDMNADGRTTVFIVSQRASAIMHADKIVVLDDGAISAIGTHDELLESNDVYKEIYMSQNAVK